ncbi:hypothetical protein Q5752_006453 [Cryptotrichosporon argae]
MPSILARLKKTPSPSTSPQRSRSASGSSLPSDPDDTAAPAPAQSQSRRLPTSSSLGSDLGARGDDTPTAALEPALGLDATTPDKRPPPVGVDGAGRPVGTPRLVLTEEGSDSPRSFTSSPAVHRSPRTASIGLGIGVGVDLAAKMDEDVETPRGEVTDMKTVSPDADVVSLGSVSVRAPSLDGLARDGHSRRGSLVQRVADKLHPTSPTIGASPSPLADAQSTRSRKSDKGRRRGKKRHGSAGSHGVAAALARSGLIAGAHGADEFGSQTGGHAKAASGRSVSTGRSPFLVRSRREKEGTEVDDASVSVGGGDEDDDGYDDEDDSEDDASDSDGIDSLPVTGFAVASNRRNAEFHQMFPAVDDGDYLIDDYGCALAKDILVQGRLYVSENHVCFHANIFGWVTDVVVPFSEVKSIEKKMTALVIPNAIGVSTGKEKYTFASLISRDSTYDVMMNVWRLANPAAASAASGGLAVSRPPSLAEDATEGAADPNAAAGAGTGAAAPKRAAAKKTECACGKEGKHYAEKALEAVFPSTPEKIYSLMFNSEFFKTFLSDDQKLKDIEMSDWRPIDGDATRQTRSTSYIKPLNGSIGPKQTKCHITDEQAHVDFDDYVSVVTTTRTPDVPSGGVFSVKTRTCLMWAGGNATRVLVTTAVEWTGKSWVKGIIEKSAIDGQKQYHDDLERGMRAHIKEHAADFAGEGDDANDVAAEAEAEAANAVPAEPAEGGGPTTAAQEYAAKTRQKRQDDDYSLLQGALDGVVAGGRAIASGLSTAGSTLADLAGLEARGLSKEAAMALVIVVLVASNVWTYASANSAARGKSKMARRIARLGVDPDIEHAVRAVLAERETRASPAEEAREIGRLLDQVERRAERLREALRDMAVREVEVERGGMDELD